MGDWMLAHVMHKTNTRLTKAELLAQALPRAPTVRIVHSYGGFALEVNESKREIYKLPILLMISSFKNF